MIEGGGTALTRLVITLVVAAALASATSSSKIDTCTATLQQLCAADRRLGPPACGLCAGSKQGAMRAAGCTNAQIGTWCGSTPHWVVTWTGAPQLTEPGNMPVFPLAGSTVRQVVHVTLGGEQVRVQFSNLFGNTDMVINAAHVAVSTSTTGVLDSTIEPSTDTALTFAGSASHTIAVGATVWSDAADFALAPLSNLTITTAFDAAPTAITGRASPTKDRTRQSPLIPF